MTSWLLLVSGSSFFPFSFFLSFFLSFVSLYWMCLYYHFHQVTHADWDFQWKERRGEMSITPRSSNPTHTHIYIYWVSKWVSEGYIEQVSNTHSVYHYSQYHLLLLRPTGTWAASWPPWAVSSSSCPLPLPRFLLCGSTPRAPVSSPTCLPEQCARSIQTSPGPLAALLAGTRWTPDGCRSSSAGQGTPSPSPPSRRSRCSASYPETGERYAWICGTRRRGGRLCQATWNMMAMEG